MPGCPLRVTRRVMILGLFVASGALVTLPPTAASGSVTRRAPLTTGSYLLAATNTGPTYEPTFTGNGELGLRVPPDGQGYAGGAVPTASELAGFYSEPPGAIQQRADIPTWSTLTFADGGTAFSTTSGQTSDWRQSIDLHTGVITTTAHWTAPDGH